MSRFNWGVCCAILAGASATAWMEWGIGVGVFVNFAGALNLFLADAICGEIRLGSKK